MHHGQNSGDAEKRKLSKKLKLNENGRDIYKSCWNRGNAICIIDLMADGRHIT